MLPALLPLPLDRICRARATLSGLLPVSPCWSIEDGTERAGRLVIKAESLMPTGSFKIRGATFKLSLLSEAERSRGVVAYSTGNHAQAVAKAARDRGVAATIVMSPDVPAAKVEATRRWGAEVVMAPPSSAARRDLAEKMAQTSGLVIVPPYDDLDVMAGQGTIGLELLEQLPPGPATVYVPIGGGGLIAGIAAAVAQHARGRDVRVVGVEPELEDDGCRSFETGRIVALPGPSGSIADAIKVQQLGELTFPVIQRHVHAVERVSEAEIVQAVGFCWTAAKLVVEPGGAVGMAAAIRSAAQVPGTAVAILCGGNIAPGRFHQLHPG